MSTVRRVAFPEAGEGVYLLLRNADHRALREKFGSEAVQVVYDGMLNLDAAVLEVVFEFAVKKDGDKDFKIRFVDLDEGITLEDLQVKLLDSFTLSLYGREHAEQMKWVRERVRQAAAEAEQDPPAKSPEDSSASSSEQPSGPG